MTYGLDTTRTPMQAQVPAAGAGPMSANETFAALTRQQWADYVQNFVPIENTLIKYATDTTLPEQAMSKASQNVTSAFDAAQGGTQRQLAGLGVQLSGDEQAAQTRAYGLSKSLADVQAQNLAGSATRARQQSVIGNPAADITQQTTKSGV
jgi:hypothetical protein